MDNEITKITSPKAHAESGKSEKQIERKKKAYFVAPNSFGKVQTEEMKIT